MKYQLEAVGVVGRLGGKGVGGWPFDRLRDQQVNVRTCQAVDKVQVFEVESC